MDSGPVCGSGLARQLNALMRGQRAVLEDLRQPEHTISGGLGRRLYGGTFAVFGWFNRRTCSTTMTPPTDAPSNSLGRQLRAREEYQRSGRCPEKC